VQVLQSQLPLGPLAVSFLLLLALAAFGVAATPCADVVGFGR